MAKYLPCLHMQQNQECFDTPTGIGSTNIPRMRDDLSRDWQKYTKKEERIVFAFNQGIIPYSSNGPSYEGVA